MRAASCLGDQSIRVVLHAKQVARTARINTKTNFNLEMELPGYNLTYRKLQTGVLSEERDTEFFFSY